MASRTEFLIFFFVLAIIFFPSANVQLSDVEKHVLDQYNNHLNESLTKRNLNNSVTYESGYGGIYGFRLSYLDALEHRNVSKYPFEDRNYSNFHENQKYSILPNSVSSAATKIWYSEEKQIHNNKNYMLNITSYLRGSFANISNYPQIDMPLPAYLEDYYSSQLNKTLDENDDIIGQQIEKIFSDDEFLQYGSDSTYSDAASGNFINFDSESKIGNISYIGSGNISFEIEAFKNSFNTTFVSIIPLKVIMKFTDLDERKIHAIELDGIYFSDNGNIFITTRSAKFESQFNIAHLLLNEKNFKEYYEYLDMKKQVEKDWFTNSSFLDMDYSLKASDKCEYLGYLKLSPSELTKSELRMIDREIDHPLGRPIAEIPDLFIKDGILYSPDCGISVTVSKVGGSSQFQHLRKLRNVVTCLSVLLFTQIYLLIRQMNIHSVFALADTGVSYYTLALINLVDGGITMLLLISTVTISSLYMTFAIVAILCFLLASVFELKWISNVLLAQANEVSFWSSATRATLNTSNEVQDDDNGTQRDLEAGPETVLAEPTIIPFDQAATTADGSPSSTIYIRYFFYFMFFSVFILNMSGWPKSIRLKTENIILCVINGYMYPQVFRCLVRGVHCSLSWEFMIGTSIIRYIPFFYMLVDKNNVFHHHTDYKFAVFLFVWKLVPLLLLFIQQNFDLRALIPKSWLPEIFSYHPSINVGELKQGLGYSGMVTTSKNSNGDTLIKANCAICMNDINIPIPNAKTHPCNSVEGVNLADANSQLLPAHSPQIHSLSSESEIPVDEDNRKLIAHGFMVTPCKHIFHDDCLQEWMRYKLQCPICRTPLPPI